MAEDLSTEHSIAIDAPVQAVWDAITAPATIERWFFGVHTETDWREGSPIVHTGTWQGRPYEDRGTIVRIEPPHVLTHTHWSALSGLPDLPEHHQRVTWTLRPSGTGTELTVSETNLPSGEAKGVSDQTWPVVLANLKQVVEG